MLIGIIFFMLISGFSGYAAVVFSGGRIKPVKWNYVFPVAGFASWMILYASGAGDMVGATNFLYETFLVFTVSVCLPWIRFLLSYFRNKYIAVFSLVLTFIPVVLAVALRLLMPCLPD